MVTKGKLYKSVLVLVVMHTELFDRLKELRVKLDTVITPSPGTQTWSDEFAQAALVYEAESETLFRRVAIRDYVIQKGLQAHMEQIIDGMNKSNSSCVLTREYQTGKRVPYLQFRDISREERNALLNYALNYVDRWEEYNNLFKDSR